jgi:hypothetical protein
MLTQSDQPLREVDPATLPPLCDEAEFAQELAELVADEAPRLFAVVQEYGKRVDGRIAAWGLAFEDYADVIGLDHNIYVGLQSPERAVRIFSHHPHITAHVVWVALTHRLGPTMTRPQANQDQPARPTPATYANLIPHRRPATLPLRTRFTPTSVVSSCLAPG